MQSRQIAAQAQRRNTALFAVREGCYSAAALFISGTLIQLYLTQQGVSSANVGLFNTALCAVNLISTIAYSGLAEKKPNSVRQSERILLAMTLSFLCYVPLFLVDSVAPSIVLVVALGVATLQVILSSCKSIFDYKMLYQIIDIAHYGSVASITGIAIGLIGIAYSSAFSLILKWLPARTVFCIGFFSSALLLLASFLCNRGLQIVHHDFDQPPQEPMSAKRILAVLKRPEFRAFIVPNVLRGVTIGILNSLVLVALHLGVTPSVAANLATMTAVGYLLGSSLYNALGRVCQAKYLGLIGGLLLCALPLLPWCGGGTLFLGVSMLGYMGRTLVDYAVPSMVFQIIDPSIAGVYNAWRTVLFSLAAAGTSYAVGAGLNRIPTVVLLALCAGAYVVCSLWYYFLLERFVVARKTNIS
jgi:hypothetical protein